MRSKKSELFRNLGTYKDSDKVNKEGHKAFSLPLDEQFVMALLTNTVENTFYATKSELAEESLKIHKDMLAKDPEFYTKAVIYARNNGCMRLQPILGTVHLSALGNKGYFKDAFEQVINTPKDLTSFIDLCRSGAVRNGMGRAIKSSIAKYFMKKLNEYYAIKYKPDVTTAYRLARINKKANKIDGKMVKVSPEFTQIVEYLFDGKVNKKLKQISALEKLKEETNENKMIKLIEEGRLPQEAVTGSVKKMSPTLWKYLMKQMPYFALIRHLDTLARNNVFDDNESVTYVSERIRDKEDLKKSKILPFRLFTAFKFANNLPTKIQDALRVALDNSFVNMPDLRGKVCIAPDVSGSMTHGHVGKSEMTYVDVAGIFSAALLKKSDDAIVLPVDTQIHEHTCSKMDSLLTNAKKISELGGGGTELDLPLKYLREKKIKVDVFIGITDNEEWYVDTRYFGRSRGVLNEIRAYKKEVNPNLKVFLVNLAPYGDSVTHPKEHNVWRISGWSEEVINFVVTILDAGKTQIDAINKTSIKPVKESNWTTALNQPKNVRLGKFKKSTLKPKKVKK